MDFKSLMDGAGQLVEAMGVASILIGILMAVGAYLSHLDSSSRIDNYRILRKSVGRSMLLGIELLLAGDIIRTVIASPSFEAVGVLLLLV